MNLRDVELGGDVIYERDARHGSTVRHKSDFSNLEFKTLDDYDTTDGGGLSGGGIAGT